MLDEVFVLDFLPGSFEIGGNSGVLVFFYTVDGRFTIFTFTIANVYIYSRYAGKRVFFHSS